MVMNETVITAVVSIIIGVFGKGFWDFWKNRDIVKGQVEINEGLTKLKTEFDTQMAAKDDELNQLRQRISQIEHEKELEIVQLRMNIDTLLQIFEIEHKNDSKYKKLINKIRNSNKLNE